jgi:TolB protein
MLIGWLTAQAQLDVTVSQGVQNPIPIAVVPFGAVNTGNVAPFDVAELIERDLGNSGYFDPMDRRDMISRPTERRQLNLQDWRIVDVDYVLFGRLLQQGGGTFRIEFFLYDVVRGAPLIERFEEGVVEDDLRRKAHQIADAVYEEITGVPGIFDTRIAYITEERRSVDDRTFRLIVADADGEKAGTIAESSKPLMSPSWSPDGRRIAYVSFESEDQSAIYVQTVSTGNRERVSARRGVNQAPAWSPDGRRLALVLSLDEGNLDVFMLDLTSQVLTRLTTNAAIDTEPEWSADGRHVYFTSGRPGSTQVYRVEAEQGARAERVTPEGRYNARPRVSPDGQQIAMIHRDSQSRDRIALLDVENGFLNVLSRGSLDESPSFAPNGAMIIYATQVRGESVLATVSSDGRVQREIKSVAGAVRDPVWGPFRLP